MDRVEYNRVRYAEQKKMREGLQRFKELYPERYAKLVAKAKEPAPIPVSEPTTEAGVLIGWPRCPLPHERPVPLDYEPMPVEGQTYWRCPVHGWLETSEVIEGQKQAGQ